MIRNRPSSLPWILGLAGLGISLSPSLAEAGHAYVWGNAPKSANYVPSKAYSRNPAGNTRIVRETRGTYQVRFSGLARRIKNGGNVMVTSYGPQAGTCSAKNWVTKGQDLLVSLKCYGGRGRLRDQQFSLLVSWKGDRGGAPFSYTWANQPKANKYKPSSAYTANHTGSVDIRRLGLGKYMVNFSGLARKTKGGGNVMVSSYGGLSGNCKASRWMDKSGNFQVTVNCYAANGKPTDSMFSILVSWDKKRRGGRLNYAWAGNPKTPFYKAPDSYSRNRSGGPVEIRRSKKGVFFVDFKGAAMKPNGGNVQVAAYGERPAHCKAAQWVNRGRDMRVQVNCFSYWGKPVNAKFSILAR